MFLSGYHILSRLRPSITVFAGQEQDDDKFENTSQKKYKKELGKFSLEIIQNTDDNCFQILEGNGRENRLILYCFRNQMETIKFH